MPQTERSSTPPIVLGPAACSDLTREWLVTDGTGGYATGTVAGVRTRHRHALLTAGLLALDITLTLPSGAKVPLFTHEWESGVLAPGGHRHLESFTLSDGLPRWRWRAGEVVVERELAVWHGRRSVAVVHRVLAAPGPVGLAVAAMCRGRDTDSAPPSTEHVADGVVVGQAYRIAGPGWQPGGEWHVGACTRDGAEDLWLAGTFFARAGAGDTMEISAWQVPVTDRPPPAAAVVAAARERARGLVAAAKAEGDAATLVLAADAFVVRDTDGPDVIAGYPSPGGHLGDTMAGYEGLFLETGRTEEGRELLTVRTKAAAREARGDAADGHAPDGPLWLVHAVDRHVARTGDTDLAAALVGPLARLLRAHLDGRGPLRVDPRDELIRQETERVGKPVESNALWVNALAAMAHLLDAAGRGGDELRARHARARASFTARFPAPEGWLYDLIDGPAAAYPLGAGAYQDDPSLRPHQVLAWSLPHAPGASGVSPLPAIGEALLTPLGLRTLAPAEYGYAGSVAGQGAVAPWLIGAYVDARAAAGLPTDGLLSGLTGHIGEWGVGSVSETADGDAPHAAGGRPFAARSVAETLRALRVAS